MLACLRDANAMAASVRDRRVGVPLGQTLFGKRVLIVGFGNIAAELIPRRAVPPWSEESILLCQVSRVLQTIHWPAVPPSLPLRLLQCTLHCIIVAVLHCI